MPTGPVGEGRLDDARGYLAGYLADEDWHGDGSREWFVEIGAYVEHLSLEDPLIARAAIYLQPFLDDDERIDCAMYPHGEAVRFIEESWGGDMRAYLIGFLNAMEQDHSGWMQLLSDAGRWAMHDEEL